MTDKEQLIYLAGLVDGEGCLSSNEYKGRYRPRFAVASTFKPVLLWARMLWGGNLYVHPTRKGQTKESYEWTLHCNQAIKLVEQLLPYLKIKKSEAMVFVSFFKVDVATSQSLAKELSVLKRAG